MVADARVSLSLRHESATHYCLDFQGRPVLHFSDSGKRGQRDASHSCPFSSHDLWRWGAPFALAPQGIISLHASAVEKDGLSVAFLGIGGAGKSTLARHLSELDWERLADDMAVIDAEARLNALTEQVLHCWCEAQDGQQKVNYHDLAERLRDPGHQRWLSLGGLLFVEETRGQEFRLRPLSPGECFEKLVTHGFGGLPTPAAWEQQFRVYAALAGRVKAGTLQVPDGLDLLKLSLPNLEELLDQWLSQCVVSLA